MLVKPGWRHHLFKTVGDGSFTPVAWDVPVSGAGLTVDLSGPSAFDGSVNPEIPRLKEVVEVEPGTPAQLVATNLLPNPVGPGATDASGWSVSPGEELTFVIDEGEPALRAYDPVGGGGIYIDPDFRPNPQVGEWVAFASEAKALDAGRAAAIDWRISAYSGTEVASVRAEIPASTTEYVRGVVTAQVTARDDAGYLRTLVGPDDDPNPGGYLVRRAMVAVGNSEADVLAQVSTYFDGDTPDLEFSHEWLESGSGKFVPAGLPVTSLGDPLIQNWQSVIVSERDGQIKGVSIIRDSPVDDAEMSLTGIGFAGYPTGLAFTDVFKGIEVDPIDQVRRIWSHLQNHPGGNLGVVVDDTKAPNGVTIGAEERDVSFETGEGEQVEFQTGPFVLAWYQTDDCGKEIDDLAEFTPFDYRMEHEWSGDTFTSFLRIGTPKIGVRRNGLRFVVGENIIDMPGLERAGDDYANEVLVLGSGEASKMRRGTAKRVPDRLRRVAVVADKSKRSNAAAAKLAENELKNRLGDPDITEITVMDHPNARFNTWSLGDEILVTTPDGWLKPMRLWCRVVSEQWNCDDDTLTLTLKKV